MDHPNVGVDLDGEGRAAMGMLAGPDAGGKPRVPGNIGLLYPPPYSPEPNPVETISRSPRQNHSSNRVFKSYTDVLDACCAAWNALVEEKERIVPIATRHWASVIL